MSYFSGSSIPKWILGSDVEELFTPESDSKVCLIKDVVFGKNVGTDSVEFFVFILTDGSYFIPALVSPSLVREHFELSLQFTVQELSKLKQQVILLENSAVGALRQENKTLPYLIIVDWKPLAEYPKKTIPSTIQCVTQHEKVSKWITSLENNLEENCISQDTRLSNVYRSKVIKRQFTNLNKYEPVLEKLLYKYLTDNTEKSTREAQPVSSSGLHIPPRKRPLNSSYSTQSEKRSKPTVVSTSSSLQQTARVTTAIQPSSQSEQTNRSSTISVSSSSQTNIRNTAPSSSSQPVITARFSSQPSKTNTPSISSTQPVKRSRPSETTMSPNSQPRTFAPVSQMSNIESGERVAPEKRQKTMMEELRERMRSIPDEVYIDYLNSKDNTEQTRTTKKTIHYTQPFKPKFDETYLQLFEDQSNVQKEKLHGETVDQNCTVTRK